MELGMVKWTNNVCQKITTTTQKRMHFFTVFIKFSIMNLSLLLLYQAQATGRKIYVLYFWRFWSTCDVTNISSDVNLLLLLLFRRASQSFQHQYKPASDAWELRATKWWRRTVDFRRSESYHGIAAMYLSVALLVAAAFAQPSVFGDHFGMFVAGYE